MRGIQIYTEYLDFIMLVLEFLLELLYKQEEGRLVRYLIKSSQASG
jgi:hypothetical protein